MIRKPNFFIVGASKCGTTAISEYLRSHPNIFMSRPKEPHYFAEDFPKIRCVRTLDQYMDLFKGSRKQHKIIGEASQSYFYSSVAVSKIYEFNRHAKILVMLRNPVDMVYSLHSEFLVNGSEKEKEFEKAWRLQSSRREGLNVPKTCLEPKFLQYRKYAQYNIQIERLLRYFPRKQVKVVLFDDFIKSTKKVYEDILSFLGVPSDGRSEFPRINANKTYKQEWLALFFQYMRPYILFWYPKARKIKQFLGIESISILNPLQKANNRVISRKPMDANLRSELVHEFKEDIENLSQILGRSLDDWIV